MQCWAHNQIDFYRESAQSKTSKAMVFLEWRIALLCEVKAIIINAKILVADTVLRESIECLFFTTGIIFNS